MATKEIPYGLSDYARLALENYYYVDKTHFIPLIEKAASFSSSSAPGVSARASR